MGFRKAFPTLQSSLFFCFYGYSKIGHSSFEISWPCATPLRWTRPFLSFTFFALICSVLVPFLAVYPEWGCLLEGSPGGSGWAPEARALQHLQTFSSRLLQGHSSASKLRPELSTQLSVAHLEVLQFSGTLSSIFFLLQTRISCKFCGWSPPRLIVGISHYLLLL